MSVTGGGVQNKKIVQWIILQLLTQDGCVLPQKEYVEVLRPVIQEYDVIRNMAFKDITLDMVIMVGLIHFYWYKRRTDKKIQRKDGGGSSQKRPLPGDTEQTAPL